MGSARRLYRIALALGIMGALAVVFAVLAALASVSLAVPSIDALLAACRRLGLPHLSPAGAAVAVLIAVGIAVGLRAIRSAVVQLRAQRRFFTTVAVVGSAGEEAGGALLVDDATPHAFCAGYARPRIYLSAGAVQRLDKSELGAVLAHEAHHAARRDPLRIFVVQLLSDALFFLPAMRRLRDRYAALAEIAADEAAVRASGDTAPLASAMLSFAEASPSVVGIAAERVDHLLGEQPRWHIPLSVAVGALVVLGATLAVGVALLADPRSAVSVPTLLAESCMITMVSAPILLGLGLLRVIGIAAGRVSR